MAPLDTISQPKTLTIVFVANRSRNHPSLKSEVSERPNYILQNFAIINACQYIFVTHTASWLFIEPKMNYWIVANCRYSEMKLSGAEQWTWRNVYQVQKHRLFATHLATRILHTFRHLALQHISRQKKRSPYGVFWYALLMPKCSYSINFVLIQTG